MTKDLQRTDRISRMTEPEIVNFFKWRGFTDQLGHPLEKDMDFLELVKRAACGGKHHEAI